MSESQQKTVPLNGVEASIAEKLIDFAYTSGTDRIKLYGLVSLRNEIAWEIDSGHYACIPNMTIPNVIITLARESLHKDPTVRLDGAVPPTPSSWGLYFKTFYGRNSQIFHNKLDCLSLASFPA
jgi:hypothetical protein